MPGCADRIDQKNARPCCRQSPVPGWRRRTTSLPWQSLVTSAAQGQLLANLIRENEVRNSSRPSVLILLEKQHRCASPASSSSGQRDSKVCNRECRSRMPALRRFAYARARACYGCSSGCPVAGSTCPPSKLPFLFGAFQSVMDSAHSFLSLGRSCSD